MGIFSKLLGIEPTKAPVSVTDDNFDEVVLRSELPVLLDVWGPSCAPCAKLEPIIMALAARYDGRLKVCEMSSHTGGRTLAGLSVRGTPTVLYFDGGKEVERVVGFRNSVYHQETIQELFGIEP